MDIDSLPDPGELWWPFAVLAALDRARGQRVWTFDAGNRLLAYDGPEGGRIVMQRLYGRRLVLWGHGPDESPGPQSWSGIPGWATSDAVRLWLRKQGATLLAWHHHNEWDGATPDTDAEAVLAPLLNAEVPADLLAKARARKATLKDLEAALDGRGDAERGLTVLQDATEEAAPLQGQVRHLLAGEIHAQMRSTRERDRMQPQRPAALVRWARVADVPPGFSFTVRAERGRLIPDPESDALSAQFRQQLLNVLEQLHVEEASEDAGAWLFARVSVDGPRVQFDRCYDSMPQWYDDTPPTLEALEWEMTQRHRNYRPAWAKLLPRWQPR